MNGPLQTELQALRLPAVQAIYDALSADPGPGKMAALNLAMLKQACAAAHIELGAYELRVLAWLSHYEPQTCAVFAGLITRAHGDAR